METIVCGIYLVLFFLLSHYFSKRPTYKRYLKSAMILSIIVGCIYWAVWETEEASEFSLFVFSSVPLICLMELEKSRR